MGSWIMRPSMPFHLFALALVGLSVLPVHCAPTCCVPEPGFDAFPKAAIATPHSSFLPHASIDFIKAEADGLRLRGGGKAKEEPILCRLKKGGANFEVMCVAGMVEKYREGHASRDEVLVSPEIFKDCKTGDRPAGEDLEKAFGTDDVSACVDVVLDKGEFQLTVAERKKKTEEKQNQIVNFVVKNFVEPRTNRNIPRERILNALEQIKGLKIDPFRSTETQALELVKKVRDVLPLTKNEMEAVVEIPLALAAKAASILRGLASVRKETYADDAVQYSVAFLCGDHERVVKELTQATQGQFQLKIAEPPMPTDADQGAVKAGKEEKGKGKGKGKGKKGKKGGKKLNVDEDE